MQPRAACAISTVASRYASVPRTLATVSSAARRWPSGSALSAETRGRRAFCTPFQGVAEGTTYTQEVIFQKQAEPIPILRLLGEDGRLVAGAKLPFSLDEAVGMYKTMVKVSIVDQIMNSLQRQGRISFYITGIGEEASAVGSCAALEQDDVLWPQYRELGAFMHRGFTVQQVVDQCLSRATDPAKGRQMPVHYVDASKNITPVTSPLATQIPQAAGAGYAFRMGGERRCSVTYFGDGAASEGDFAVALNFAATLKAQTLFVCRNNGWAISTPAKEQYRGDGIAARGVAYGMNVIRADGNDLAAAYLATQRAREICVEQGEPVVIELMTYRRGHHSTSDDAARYRPGEEVKMMASEGVEPVSRVRLLLESEGLWDEAKDAELRKSCREEVMDALKTGEAKKFAPISDMFVDVFAKETPLLLRQKAELFEHLERHSSKYKLDKYDASRV
eukprot:gnl/TRDRNA2_/TRDRNA2_42157_c0_seq1.p1 gnl/TRDRNA2_/TRDRNA2_42157_c0~~gnl/TRDRNA2_/TRDRNA2_42157_c0_seq1.p1  ORF type:complete len:448 (-),score=83.83 gnl/TRDRNA2_/TRDRNA2_42157_c0_seq1:130-1473(-)